MKKLSVIIVNYNVEHFLEQCLTSVYQALANLEAEVFVVDNNSVDGSLTMIQRKFPQVHLIANKDNVGFAKANNQAIKLAQGEYVLLLNPDTVVENDTFDKIIQFMENTADAGALGVKMVNGKGEFLPESKRGLPLPSVAFYKIFGLSKFFPKSKKFGSYHLTYLDNNQIHSVEILSGAFMLIRKKVLDQIGLLDEDYFMYGEDIDLSYRIIKNGYKNYYYPETRIIHYKGESTKKTSINYVFVFYRAMQIFAKKHFSQKNAVFLNWLINMAIYLRASLAILKRLVLALFLPILDFIALYAGMFAITQYWEYAVLAERGSSFPVAFFQWVLPLYTLIWILGVAAYKGYHKPIRLSKTNKGFIAGTITILLIYALLPETFRFSRAVVVIGAMWSVIAMNSLRYVLHRLKVPGYALKGAENRRIVVVGKGQEAARVLRLVQLTNPEIEFLRIVSTDSATEESSDLTIGELYQLKEIVAVYKIKELIFCAQNLSPEEIIDLMEHLRNDQVEYKIVPAESNAIIGSNSIATADDIFMVHLNSINLPKNRRKKRIFDILTSCCLILFCPLNIWAVKSKRKYINALIEVLKGEKSWVGYHSLSNSNLQKLPVIPAGILPCTNALGINNMSEDIIAKANQVYANDYKFSTDLKILIKGHRGIGRG